MRKFNLLAPVLLTATLTILPNLNAAATVMVMGVGSSAQYKEACVGAFLNLSGGVGQGHHYTIKGNAPSGNGYGQMHDTRNSMIANQSGNIWIVWNNAQTEVWAYLSVDSVVGNRGFFARPRSAVTFQLDPSVETTAGQNLIAAALFGGQADDLSVPAAIYTALNNATFNAAFTDIRPEDAKFAQCRTASTLEAVDYTALGYGTTALTACATAPTQVGTPIVSAVSNPPANAQPVAFNISGTDPITGVAIAAYTTIPIGVAPIVFIENRTDTAAGGLGAPGALHNISLASIQSVYTTGAHCDTDTLAGVTPAQPLTVFNREPMSGTFNTTEFTNFRLTGTHHTKTQEFGVNPLNANNNPLLLTCGLGNRMRAIGTGEVGKGVLNSGTAAVPGSYQNSIGYMFFSYSNVQPFAGNANYGYMTVQGVDPLFSTYTTGILPACSEPCPITPGDSFPNLRNGTYRTWSLLRVVTDASGANYTHVKNLVAAAQAHVNETDPDFVPFVAQPDGDPGFSYYRSHFLQEGVTPSNGLPNGVGTEHGGDMGGCIEPGGHGSGPGVLSCRQ